MSIGSVKVNMARLSTETRNSLEELRREAAEAKLFYMRDTLDPEAFDELVDNEIRKSLTTSPEPELNLRDLARKIKKRISRFFR